MESPDSPKLSRQLVAPRQPILWLSPARAMLLKSPILPSSLTRFLGTRNNDIPLTPGGDPGILASTM